MSSADRIALLTERNRGTRIKSDAEQYLEAAGEIGGYDVGIGVTIQISSGDGIRIA